MKDGDRRSDGFCPQGWKDRGSVLRDVIRFGPGLLPKDLFLVFLFLVERMLFFGKERDKISASQSERGVYWRARREWLRFPGGFSVSTFWRAIEVLHEYDLVFKFNNHLPGRHNREASTFQINWGRFHQLVEAARRSDVDANGRPANDTRRKIEALAILLRKGDQGGAVDMKAQDDDLVLTEAARSVAILMRAYSILVRRMGPTDSVCAVLACATKLDLFLTLRDIVDVLTVCNYISPNGRIPIRVKDVSQVIREHNCAVVANPGRRPALYQGSPHLERPKSALRKLHEVILPVDSRGSSTIQ